MFAKTVFIKWMPVLLAVCMLASCDNSIDGYYASVKDSPKGKINLSLELNKDSSALFVTDYNNYKPEIVQEGKWKLKEHDLIHFVFRSNLMEFKREGRTLTYIDKSKKGNNGFSLDKQRKPADTGRHLIAWVAPELPHLPLCRDSGHTKCLRIRWGQEDEGNYFMLHDTIKDFQFTEGINYKLRIKRNAADSLHDKYVLEEVLLQRKLDKSTYY